MNIVRDAKRIAGGGNSVLPVVAVGYGRVAGLGEYRQLTGMG